MPNINELYKMHIHYLDMLRVLAIFCVISIHASGLALVEATPGSNTWWVANAYHSVGTLGVPIFVMISGALLLSKKQEPILNFFYSRFLKIIIPAIAWIIVYHIYQINVEHQPFDANRMVKAILNLHQKDGLSAHLWFIPMIFGLYLATPFVRIFVANASANMILAALTIWAIFCILLPFIYYFTGIYIGIDQTIFTPWIGYFVLGYFLHHHAKGTNLTGFILLLILSVIVTMAGAYHYALNNKVTLAQPFNIFYCYLTPGTLAMTISIFMLIRNTYIRFQITILPVVEKTSRKVFGIFLIHILFLNPMLYAWSRTLNPVPVMGPVAGIFVLIVTSFVLSFFSVWVMQQLPGLKKLVP